MIDEYKDVVERLKKLLNDWVQTDGEDAPEEDLQLLEDTLALLKRYREGLEQIPRIVGSCQYCDERDKLAKQILGDQSE